MNEFFMYGEKNPRFEVRVLNEREARAAAILFVGAFLGLVNCLMLGSVMFSKYFVTFFAIDFTIRIIQPRFAPSLLLGRFFVQNQIPEYVGAAQKRFAWILGALLAWTMFYSLVLDFQPSSLYVIYILGCLICMGLLFFEAAFSICMGCKIFEWITRKSPKYCPGGICEMNIKEQIQKFTFVQASIVILTIFIIGYGVYAYFTKLPDKTVLTKKIKVLMMSDTELKELEYAKAIAEFEKDDF